MCVRGWNRRSEAGRNERGRGGGKGRQRGVVKRGQRLDEAMRWGRGKRRHEMNIQAWRREAEAEAAAWAAVVAAEMMEAMVNVG